MPRSSDAAATLANISRSVVCPDVRRSRCHPISYQAGDRIVGLALDAWWNAGDFAGIRAIRVEYTPDMDSSPIILASGSDVGRQGWKTIALTEHQFAGIELAPYGQLWVEIEFALQNYRIGYATAIFERPCR